MSSGPPVTLVESYARPMDPAGRPHVEPEVLAPEPVDTAVLPPSLNGMLWELPWWDRGWRVTHVEPAHPCEIAADEDRRLSRFTEVAVPGTVSRDAAETLPFSARVRWAGHRLVRFQAKIGDTVLGPATGAAGEATR
jgi:hypothetical protein